MYARLQSLKTILEKGLHEELTAELDGILLENKGTQGLESLLTQLKKGDKAAALLELRLLMAAKQAPVRKADADLRGLKTTLMLHQTRLSAQTYRKQELLRVINQFRVKHNQQLGGLMTRILFLRKELLYLEMNENKKKRADFDEASREYEAFEHEYQRKGSTNHPPINEEEQKQLSLWYRQASKLCHPDMVSEEMRTEAEGVFNQLNAAYVGNDVAEVKRIWDMLKGGGIRFAAKSEEVKEEDRLRVQIHKVEKEIARVLSEIKHIEESTAYQTIRSLEDQDQYFAGIRERLEKELLDLEASYEEKKGTGKV
jgi:hypothetical protein